MPDGHESGIPGDLAEACKVLGVEPGVSPLRARQRYRQLVKQWHPDRHPKDPQSQAAATRRTQELSAAYKRVKDAARRGEVPMRTPSAWRPSPAAGPPVPVVDTLADRALRFVVGAVVGVIVDFEILSDSLAVWIGIPVTLGLAVAAFGWAVLEWVLRKVWWLA